MSETARTTSWLYRLLWNRVYWGIVGVMLALALVMGILAELEYRRQHPVSGARVANIEDGQRVRVMSILNGDEFVVSTRGGRAVVRMIGIRSFDPVVNERDITAYGHASVVFLEEWLLNSEVELEFDVVPRDERGRYLAYVRLGDIDMNRRMVEEGTAMVYTEFPTAREQDYLTVEIEPRRARRGIWGGKKSRRRIAGLREKWMSQRLVENRIPLVDPFLEARK